MDGRHTESARNHSCEAVQISVVEVCCVGLLNTFAGSVLYCGKRKSE